MQTEAQLNASWFKACVDRVFAEAPPERQRAVIESMLAELPPAPTGFLHYIRVVDWAIWKHCGEGNHWDREGVEYNPHRGTARSREG